MKCQRCKSERIVDTSGHFRNVIVTLDHLEVDGTIPDDLGLGGGDYVRFSFCLDCGQMQGRFPVPPSLIERDLSDEEITEYFDQFLGEDEPIHQVNDGSLEMKEAYVLHPKFGKFMNDLLDNLYVEEVNRKKGRVNKWPTLEKFIHMFRTNNIQLEK
jgi:hypothetical protein